MNNVFVINIMYDCIIYIINNFIHEPAIYINVTSICKHMQSHHKHNIERLYILRNRVATLIVDGNMPTNTIDWKEFTSTTLVPLSVIDKYSDKRLDWKAISTYHNLTLDFVNKYIHKGWSIKNLSANPCMYHNIISLRFYNVLGIEHNHRGLSQNPLLTAYYVTSNLYMNWDTAALARTLPLSENIFGLEYIAEVNNHNISINTVIANPQIDWDLDGILEHNYPDIHVLISPYSFNKSYPDYDRIECYDNIISLLEEGDISIDTIHRMPNITWDWLELSKSKYIKWQDIIDNINYPWDWSMISRNPNITLDIVLSHSYLPWSWPALLMTIKFSDNELDTYINNGLDINIITRNNHVAYNLIIKYKHLDWNLNLMMSCEPFN